RQERLRRRVRRHQVPRPVDHDGRIWLVSSQDQVERLPNRRELGPAERALGERWRVTGGEQQPVLLAERDVKLAEDPEQHVAAGFRATRLEEAQVPCRYPGFERQLELAQPPPLAPLAEQGPNPLFRDRGRHRRGMYSRRIGKSITSR